MSIDVVSPLRQRMIEDMTARQARRRHAEALHQPPQAVRRVSPTLT